MLDFINDNLNSQYKICSNRICTLTEEACQYLHDKSQNKETAGCFVSGDLVFMNSLLSRRLCFMSLMRKGGKFFAVLLSLSDL